MNACCERHGPALARQLERSGLSFEGFVGKGCRSPAGWLDVTMADYTVNFVIDEATGLPDYCGQETFSRAAGGSQLLIDPCRGEFGAQIGLSVGVRVDGRHFLVSVQHSHRGGPWPATADWMRLNAAGSPDLCSGTPTQEWPEPLPGRGIRPSAAPRP